MTLFRSPKGSPVLGAGCGRAEEGDWDLHPASRFPPVCRLWGAPFSSVLTETPPPIPACPSSALGIALNLLA